MRSLGEEQRTMKAGTTPNPGLGDGFLGRGNRMEKAKKTSAWLENKIKEGGG